MEYFTTNETQAALLVNTEWRPLILRLMEAEGTVAALAEELNWGFQQVHYRVRVLERAGLAQVVRTQARKGNGVKVYRIPGMWFVPFRLTGASTVGELLEAQVVPEVRGLLQTGERRWRELAGDNPGLWFGGSKLFMLFSTDQGPLALSHALESEPFLLAFSEFSLSRNRAMEFRDRLRELCLEFRDEPDEETRTIHTAFFMTEEG